MDPLKVFQSLSATRVYRHPDVLAEAWKKVEAAEAALRQQFDACQTDGERLSVVVDIVAQLVATARRRSSDCQLKCPDLGCENIDVETVLANWLEYVQQRTVLS